MDTFRAACTTHGTPQSTLTDNGLVFTTRHRGGPNGFEIELLDPRHRPEERHPEPPPDPGQGRAPEPDPEALARARPAAPNPADLQALLDEFTDYYNTRRPHRSLNRRTPAEVYAARAKATPDHNRGGHFRIRDDTVHANGQVTLRRGGRLHHIGLGTEHAGTHVRMLIHDLHVTVINRDTGEILRELVLNPDKNNQPRGLPPRTPEGLTPPRRHEEGLPLHPQK